MIEIRRKNELGQTNLDWLEARHHFSFGQYYDPARMHFGAIRVINDDKIKAGTGFDMHPHKNMEIITYVKTGAIHHRDSLGNSGVTNAGDIQIMSAGSGILHSEYAAPDKETTLYQIWLLPEAQDLPPRWEQTELPKGKAGLQLIASHDPPTEAVLKIQQQAELWAGDLLKGETYQLPISSKAYLLVADGDITLAENHLQAGDAALLMDMRELAVIATSEARLLLLNL